MKKVPKLPSLPRLGAGVALALSLAILAVHPQAAQRQPQEFHPQPLTLGSWRLIDRQPIAGDPSQTVRYDRLRSGQIFQYQQASTLLTVEIHYLVNSRGNLATLRQKRPELQGQTLLDRTPVSDGQSFYWLYHHRDRAYLYSCIPPQGPPTATPEQFLRNQKRHLWQRDRLLPLVLGQITLPDQRCLWVQLTLSASGNNSVALPAIWPQVWPTLQAQFPAL